MQLSHDSHKRNGSPVFFTAEKPAGFSQIGEYQRGIAANILILKGFPQKGIAIAKGVLCRQLQTMLLKIEITVQ